jgi:hypothetical protein
VRFIFVLLLLLLVAGGAFFAGRWYGKQTAESGRQRSVILTDEMVILTEEGEPKGLLPVGTRLYAIPDPWGDRTSLFKLYLRTEVSDEDPLRPSQGTQSHGFQYEFYWLKSRQRLDANEHQPPGADSKK